MDITGEVQAKVRESGIKEGIAVVFAIGSTCAISTIEYEPGLKKDLPEILEKLIPSRVGYHHNGTWGDGNGHSHLRATLLGPSLTVPVSGGDLVLGTWQQIVFIELDIRPRSRRVFIQILGE